MIGFFFQFFKRDVAMATNFGQNWHNDLQSASWRFETGRNMAVLTQKYSMAIL